MTDTSIYRDIAQRTDGAFMLGVVGPVRTGKSTFIKRFMETLIMPRIENTYMRERARDELPQSGSGRTIMTAEPKFVPEDAVNISLGESTVKNVYLCRSYVWTFATRDDLYTLSRGIRSLIELSGKEFHSKHFSVISVK